MLVTEEYYIGKCNKTVYLVTMHILRVIFQMFTINQHNTPYQAQYTY